MRERERLVVGGLVVSMLILWLGFLVHRSPRFAGSFEGFLLGLGATLLMLVPLAYVVVKRIKPIRRRITAKISMRTLLTWHIYAGVLAPILALLHTGHRFESTLGIALIAVVLVVALSGFVGRHLLRMVGEEATERRALRDRLQVQFDELAQGVRTSPDQVALAAPLARPFGRWLGQWLFDRVPDSVGARPAAIQALRVSEALADVETAVGTHEAFKRWFSRWLRFHIALTVTLYLFLAAHIAVELSLGLRWL